MIRVSPVDYQRVIPLISSRNEITVFSALENTIDNEVYVDDLDTPSTTLIKVPGKNYIAGSPLNKAFIADVSSVLSFWDQLTPDTHDWAAIASTCHPNKFIRLYKRRRYELRREDWKECSYALPEGYVLEKVHLPDLRAKGYQNADKVFEWTSDYKDDENFMRNGVGFYVRTENTIASWSLSDGNYKDKIAIGINSDEAYRRKGLSIAAAAATVKECFARGFVSIDWLCVDFNKGSCAIAEKLGFRHVATYDTFTSYPPCENLLDLSEDEWNEWGAYYEGFTSSEPRLLGEQLSAYIKANNFQKTKETILSIEKQQKSYAIQDLCWVKHLPGMIAYFQSIGRSLCFYDREWDDFVKEHLLNL